MQTVIADVILSYPHLFEMHKFATDADDKLDYSANFIFPQDFNYDKLGQAIQGAIVEKWPTESQDPAFVAQLVMPYKIIAKDGPYKGYNNITARCRKTKPQVLDQNLNPIMDRGLVGAGSKVNAQINVFGYFFGGKYGVSVTLNMIQLVETAGSAQLPSLGGEVQNPADHFQQIPGAPAPAAMPGAAPAAMVPQTGGMPAPAAAPAPVAPVAGVPGAAPAPVPGAAPAPAAVTPTIPGGLPPGNPGWPQ